jgi:hypothetical protein
MRLSLAAVAVALSSCTFPQVVSEALNTEFKPTGEVRVYDRSASWDAVRVRSPKINVSKRTDGSWGGMLGDRAIDVSVTPTRISGVDFTLSRDTSDAARTVITGQFYGKIYRFEFDATQAMVRAPTISFTLQGRVPGKNEIVYGPMQNMRLIGEAGADDPPWPQFGFALVAMMQ